MSSEQVKEQQIAQLREKIDRLTVLFSKGEISEESYKSAVKIIEDDIDRLRSGKDVRVSEKPKPKPSALWYLAPTFFLILGGVIGYVGVKDRDEEMALSLLVGGFLMTILIAILYLAALVW